ncbi:hypothetical protein [Mucilaginibacter paludis]|nr:hypothetical protein [Mucilaginibacter paludis]
MLVGLLLLASKICTAQDRIIIMIDSTIFNKTNNIADLDNFKLQVAQALPDKIVRFRAPGINTFNFSLYVFSPGKNEFYAKEVYSGHRWHEIELVERYHSLFSNIKSSKTYGNAFEFLSIFDANAFKNHSLASSAGETIFVILSQVPFPYCTNTGGLNTMLTFKQVPRNDFITFNYRTSTIKPDSLGESRAARVGVYEYRIKRTVDNIFLGPGQQMPLTFNSVRETAPSTLSLSLKVKDNYTSLKLNLQNATKIQIDAITLNYIKGKDSQSNLLPNAGPVVLKSNDNTLPRVIMGKIGVNNVFPLYEMVQPYLKLYANMPTDTVYYGQLLVKYQLFDVVDPFIKFADTITFKVTTEAPKNLYLGFNGKKLLDNANLIKYGNKFSPKVPVTQDVLIKKYGSTLQYLIYAVIGLLIAIIVLVWYFLIKKKRLTLSNARTFWK